MTTTTTTTTATIPPPSIHVGGEIDAACNKCELTLAHTIIAMVGPKVKKVECNTCHTVHAYKGVQPLVPAKVKKPGKPRAPRASKVVVTWEERLAGKDVARAKKYTIRDTYKADDVIDHPTFGIGLVSSVRLDKVEVAFKAFDKTLIHGKSGHETQASYTHAKPGSVAMGTADKPPTLDGQGTSNAANQARMNAEVDAAAAASGSAGEINEAS